MILEKDDEGLDCGNVGKGVLSIRDIAKRYLSLQNIELVKEYRNSLLIEIYDEKMLLKSFML